MIPQTMMPYHGTDVFDVQVEVGYDWNQVQFVGLVGHSGSQFIPFLVNRMAHSKQDAPVWVVIEDGRWKVENKCWKTTKYGKINT